MRKKPTTAQWERFQTQSREEQIEIIKRHLSRVFNRRFATSTDESFEYGRDHAESCFIANRMSKYIRQEDNSVRGFHRRYQNFNSPGHREEFVSSRLAQMCEIPTPVPPQFVALANYDGNRRFVEINYQGTKPMIGDGTMSNTFPYYDAYSPLIDHPAIYAYLWQEKAFLGADDGEATHSLVLDMEKNKIYIATRRQAHQFLEIQLPQTPEERRAEDDRLQKLFADFHAPKKLGDLQNMGMFQFVAPVNDRSKEVAAMSKFLDQYIPENVQQAMMECIPA